MIDELRDSPWITFEGIEGSGKSTQLKRLARRLRIAGHAVVETKEPGGTDLGQRLRAILLDPGSHDLAPQAELLLYTADRVQHLEQVVLPAIGRHDIVLCDRYLDATLAYQGFGRGLDPKSILRLHREPPLDLRPDRTLLFDLDPNIALGRARRRNDERGVAASEGRFEDEELDFHRRVREGYLVLAAAEPERFRVIDGDGETGTVEQRVTVALRDTLPILGGLCLVIALDGLIGHEGPRASLRRMLESGRVPHSQLFQGPEGVGKATAARAFANALLCDDPRDNGACAECSSCRLLDSETHPDLARVELLPKGETVGLNAAADTASEDLRKVILVDQIRELTRIAGMAPRMSRRRIFIIDPADQMMLAAQNALLKTLEEPPGNSILILIASRPHLLVPTVRSRCFQIRFGAAKVEELAAHLAQRGIERAEALTRAALAEGRAGRALALDLDELRERREALLGSLEALTGHNSSLDRLPAMVGVLAGKTEDSLTTGMELLQTLLRDAARAAVNPGSSALIHADLAERLSRLGQRLGPLRASSLVRSTERLRGDLRFNLNRTLIAESLLSAVAGGPLP